MQMNPVEIALFTVEGTKIKTPAVPCAGEDGAAGTLTQAVFLKEHLAKAFPSTKSRVL